MCVSYVCICCVVSAVPPFKPELISESVLQKLLKQNVIEEITVKDLNAPNTFIVSTHTNTFYTFNVKLQVVSSQKLPVSPHLGGHNHYRILSHYIYLALYAKKICRFFLS